MKKYNHIVQSSTAKYSSIIKYLKYISSVMGRQLTDEQSINYDRNGHLRLATEIGYSLEDVIPFIIKNEVIELSYILIYLRRCKFMPKLSKQEYINAINNGNIERNMLTLQKICAIM